MECINKVSNDLSYYKSNINTFDINYIGDQYYNFLKNV